jgi:hypothetical protein
MAGNNIKIELELPDFEKELNITVTLQRDGEVLKCTSSTSGGIKENIEPLENFGAPVQRQSVRDDSGNGWKQKEEINSSMGSGGNMMNLNF